MRHVRSSVLLGAILFLALGCGGLAPCCGADFGAANPSYAGNYSGGFFPSGSSNPALTFALTVLATGELTGTVTKVQNGDTAAVTGSVVDMFFACSDSRIGLNLDFTLPSESSTRIIGSRPQSVVTQWPFNSTATSGTNETVGTVQLEKN